MFAKSVTVGILVFFLLVISGLAQDFTFTTSSKNIISSKAQIEYPGLDGNPNAIIVATPMGSTATANPYPIGVWYYNGKWNIFNTNHANLSAGLQFRVQVHLRSDANRFLHLITRENLIGGGSYLDNPALNNNPTAKLTIFQNHSPDNRSASLNKYEAKVEYDPTSGKWCIKNVNGEALYPHTAYNVVISSAGTGNTPKLSAQIPELITTPTNTGATGIVLAPGTSGPGKTAIPTNNAGGDLGGTFPNPTVIGLQGKPISSKAPTVGDILRWNGATWEATKETIVPVSTSSSVAKPSVSFFSQTGNSIGLDNPNVNILSIPGLDNQTFILSQNSRVVFQTTAQVQIYSPIQANATGYTLYVEILNSSNAVVARSASYGWLTQSTPQTVVSIGIGILPAGTYKTKIWINRQAGGATLIAFVDHSANQRSQLIFQIYPE